MKNHWMREILGPRTRSPRRPRHDARLFRFRLLIWLDGPELTCLVSRMGETWVALRIRGLLPRYSSGYPRLPVSREERFSCRGSMTAHDPEAGHCRRSAKAQEKQRSRLPEREGYALRGCSRSQF